MRNRWTLGTGKGLTQRFYVGGSLSFVHTLETVEITHEESFNETTDLTDYPWKNGGTIARLEPKYWILLPSCAVFAHCCCLRITKCLRVQSGLGNQVQGRRLLFPPVTNTRRAKERCTSGL